VAKCCPQRGILLPPLCCLNLDEVTEEMADIHCGMRYPYQRKIPQILSYSFFWRLKSMEQWRYGKTNFFLCFADRAFNKRIIKQDFVHQVD